MEAQSFWRSKLEGTDLSTVLGSDLFLPCCRGKSREPGELPKVRLPPASCLRLALSWWVCAAPSPAVDLATPGLGPTDLAGSSRASR